MNYWRIGPRDQTKLTLCFYGAINGTFFDSKLFSASAINNASNKLNIDAEAGMQLVLPRCEWGIS